jgi:hypothetical protein
MVESEWMIHHVLFFHLSSAQQGNRINEENVNVASEVLRCTVLVVGMKFNFKVASPYTLPTFAGASGVACLGHES